MRLMSAPRSTPWLALLLPLIAPTVPDRATAAEAFPPAQAGVTYTNQRLPKVPWSIHVVRVPRNHPDLQVRSTHAGAAAIGLTLLSSQVDQVRSNALVPLAGINGDFYQRARAHAGDPRGLQIVDGELLSGPSGGAAFWIDAQGQPHASNVTSKFEVVWPAGNRVPVDTFDVNGDRAADGIQLYTRAVGATTHTTGGREFILVPAAEPWNPLRIGSAYRARVQEVRETGDSPVAAGTLVLSLGPEAVRKRPHIASIQAGATLDFVTRTVPDLTGAREAIGGGPALVRGGRRLKIVPPPGESYEATSMLERHPRTALGWNAKEYLLVVVDGRQKNLSVGMTLEELGETLVKLGCTEAMNLDGGGSATLWYDGAVKNSPCDGRERPIANSLLIVSPKAPTTR